MLEWAGSIIVSVQCTHVHVHVYMYMYVLGSLRAQAGVAGRWYHGSDPTARTCSSACVTVLYSPGVGSVEQVPKEQEASLNGGWKSVKSTDNWKIWYSTCTCIYMKKRRISPLLASITCSS